MLNEQPILIWSDKERKWISKTIYFVNQPATTTNILDIDTDASTPTTSEASFNPVFEPTSGYKEILPLGSIFPTTETWYTDNSKTKKIVEKDIVWSKLVPSAITYKLYSSDGSTIITQIHDELNYYNNIFLTKITRSVI
jgi:hypothetical protein